MNADDDDGLRMTVIVRMTWTGAGTTMMGTDDDDGLRMTVIVRMTWTGAGTTMIGGDDVDRDGNDGVMCGDDRRLE